MGECAALHDPRAPKSLLVTKAWVNRAIEAGAAGVVSGLAAALPGVVAELIHNPSEGRARAVAELRRSIERYPFHSALKTILRFKGIPMSAAVRAPLRILLESERLEFERLIPHLLSAEQASLAFGSGLDH